MGTNSFHLLVARADASGYLTVLDAHKESVRLGEAITEGGLLPKEKLDHAILALQRIKAIASRHKPVYRVVATQATRAASNYAEIIRRIRAEVQLKVEIIDGLEEARLTYLGMSYCHEPSDAMTLALDIGGGSTELVIGRGGQSQFMTSLKLGALTTSRRFLAMSSPSFRDIAELKDYVHTSLAPLVPEARRLPVTLAFATSGTAKAIARMHHYEKYGHPLEQTNGYQFAASELPAIEQQLSQLAEPQAIRNHYKIDARRADIILAGMLIFSRVTEIFQVSSWTFSSFGIREGIILDTYARMQLSLNVESANQQTKSIQSFAARLGLDTEFAGHLERFALKIFDEALAKIPHLQLPPRIDKFRSLLAAAAYLNEAGKFLNFKSYHKHSYYLISRARLLGFSQEEKHLVALINRFARKKTATESHQEDYPYLTHRVATVNFLGACIRAARAANRSRMAKIDGVQLGWQDGAVNFQFYHQNGLDVKAEEQAFRREQRAIAKAWALDVDVQFIPSRREHP